MQYYPVNLDLRGRLVVVAGGGIVAARRVRRLLECGARVRIVSPKVLPELRKLAQRKDAQLKLRPFRRSDVRGAFMVLAATDSRAVNRRVCLAARESCALVNVADAPREGDFLVPAAFEKAGVMVAVSTSGRNPALAKRLRLMLQKELAALLSRPQAAACRSDSGPL